MKMRALRPTATSSGPLSYQREKILAIGGITLVRYRERDASIQSMIGQWIRCRLHFTLKTDMKSKDAHRGACDAARYCRLTHDRTIAFLQTGTEGHRLL
jgi:hypothetical protein